jgi:serine/threonine protein kinase
LANASSARAYHRVVGVEDDAEPPGGYEAAPTLPPPKESTDTPSLLLHELAHSPEVVARRLAAGSRLADGRYTVLRVVGRGGMGTVYLATDEALGKPVALKAMSRAFAGDREHLRDEVRLAQEVTHRNVCRTYDLEEVDGMWLVKMEYVEGKTLAERVAADGPLSATEARGVARDIALGLAAAHERGVVHRDLKPQNVIIEARTGRVVLMDFGIARLAQPTDASAENVAGTPEFMAPEQARGREVDGRADLYALGCVFYYMVTGQVLFSAKTPMAMAVRHIEDAPPPLPSSVPEPMRRLVARLLEKDPAHRPQRAEEVAAALGGGPSRRGAWIAAAGMTVAAIGLSALALRPGTPWKATVRELSSAWEDSDFSAFSPDSKSFAYNSDRDEPGHHRLYVAPVAGGPARILTPRELDVGLPRWTRDGRAILFIDENRSDAYRVQLQGGQPTLAVAGASSIEDCGGRLALVRGSPGCPFCPSLVVRDEKGEREVRRYPSGWDLALLRCDAAGRRLVFSLSEGRNTGVGFRPFDLWVLDLDGGEPRQLTHDQAINLGTFAADGRSIVFSAVQGGHHHIFELPLDRVAAPVQLTFGDEDQLEPDVAPDGHAAIFHVETGTFLLFEVGLDGGAQRKVTGASTYVYTHVNPSPDGKVLFAQEFAVAGRRQLVRIPLEGGDPSVLGEGESPALTPDGAELLFGRGPKLLAMPTHGENAPRVVADLPGTAYDLHVGQDGRVHMMITRQTGHESWSVPLAGGVPEHELPLPWTDLLPAPQGGWRAAVEKTNYGTSRVRFLAPGAPLDPGTRAVEVESGAWAYDGRSFFYSHAGHVRRVFMESGEDREVPTLGNALVAAVAADGASIFISQQTVHTRRELITNFADRPRP